MANNADPLVILEASLTSIKYALYQAVGCSVLWACGVTGLSTTILSSTSIGFIGGAIFTVPYLILLFVMPDQDHEDIDSSSRRAYLLGKEMMYSAVSGGVGVVLFEGWSGENVLVGMGQGLVGPFIFFAIAYCLLKVILGATWIITSFRSPSERHVAT